MRTQWDKETDVVVVGYGLSGAVAAIKANDPGLEVLILEKGQYPGGCSILSAGAILCARDIEEASKYLLQTSGGRVDTNVIRHFAQGLVDNEQYLRELVKINNGKVECKVRTTFYPFEGYSTFYTVRIHEIPGFSGSLPWVQRLNPAGVNLMKTVMDNIEAQHIEVRLSTPAKSLVTDTNGAVIGVIAETAGREIPIKARRAVILACGGFEQNEWLLKQYLQGTPFYSMAPLTHTGDGIFMAQKVGAALWHMWHVHGSYGFKFPEFPIAFRTPFSGPRNPKLIMPWIVVDKFGTRYMNEYQAAPQDTMHRAMELFDSDMPGYSRIPSYIIFDEAGRKRGPIAQPLAIGGYKHEWSKDNMQEVAKGWVLRGGNIRELALRIREMTDNEAKMEPDILEATVSEWNNVVKAGKDPFHRLTGTMMPIRVPPFYAAPVWPIITNTQGGPQHNEKQQVIDAFGEPIPHLYSAGELGSFWSHLYLLSGNLGECLSSGRVAGRKAAEEPAIS